ncbi:MAG: polysaccharide biosynthesis/export family protein [Pseudomonadota bacterium]
MRCTTVTAIAAAVVMSGCAAMKTPENIEDAAQGGAYQAHYRTAADDLRDARNARSSALNAERCVQAPDQAAGSLASRAGWALSSEALSSEALSPGDLIEVTVGSDAIFSGNFEISSDGMLRLPHLRAIPALGREAPALEQELAEALLREGFYRRAPRTSIRLTDTASAKVFVAGAVFEAGQHAIGRVGGEDRDTHRQEAIGAGGGRRSVSGALRAAGGIRPDADLAHVRLTRAGQTRVLDLQGAIEGRPFEDASLIAGDQIEVPSRGCFQERLMTANAISPPGISVYMSNLTKPADANAISAIGRDTRQVPYGARFLQTVVSMNCVGGTQATNADRYAVLFSRNPITGASVVIERRIETLLRRADRDELDPYLLPGDAIACYDSSVTNLTEIAKSIAIVLGTGVLLAL